MWNKMMTTPFTFSVVFSSASAGRGKWIKATALGVALLGSGLCEPALADGGRGARPAQESKRERLADAAVNSQGINQARALESKDGVIRLVGDAESRSRAEARAVKEREALERQADGALMARLGARPQEN